MSNRTTAAIILVISFITTCLFVGSCVIMLSDGQGALIFVFTIPAITALQFTAGLLGRRLKGQKQALGIVSHIPKVLTGLLLTFFVSAFIPGTRAVPEAFVSGVGNVFVRLTGKTPYAFFRERASFPVRLEEALKTQSEIRLGELDVSFAWDKVCIFGPYTNNQKARQVLGFDWDLEARSQIHFSDSINALIFLYQGSVNQVVDLRRRIVDFKVLDVCLPRPETTFKVHVDLHQHKFLQLSP